MAKINEVCDALVAAIDAAWTGQGADDGVERLYLAPVTEEDLPDFVGRRVYVFPGRKESGTENRGEDRITYGVGIIIVERCTDAGDPSRAWMDERVDWVEDVVEAAVDYDGRTYLPVGSRRIFTETIDTETYSFDALNELGMFYSEMTLSLFEVSPH